MAMFPQKSFSIEKIIDLRHWTPSILSFSVTRPARLRYCSGQYARIGLLVDNRLIWRAFSFVSAPHEKLLEFIAVLVPGGLFTSKLQSAVPGESIYIEHENYGFLTLDRFADGEDLWLLATGTGIGPFISMLRSPELWNRFQRVIVVHGVRSADELTYCHELEQWIDKSPVPDGASLTVVRCISRNDGSANDTNPCSTGNWIKGRITTAWDQGTLEATANCPVSAHTSRVMLCGNPHMIEDMRTRLHARGMKPCRRVAAGQFVTENYW